MGSQLDYAEDRISSINFETLGEESCESYPVLVHEYLRRLNLFMDTFSVTVKFYPFVSVASVLSKIQYVDIFKVWGVY
jgi:hypothetical protein